MDSKFQKVLIESWEAFFKFSEGLKSLGDSLPYWSFRGQYDSNWTLKPSLKRILDFEDINFPEVAVKLERTLFRHFMAQNIHFPEFKDYQIEQKSNVFTWTLMQHYGCPTRLLDWSDSPYVALYHAVEGGLDKDGALYVINNHVLEEKNNEQFEKIGPTSDFELDFSNAISSVIATVGSKRLGNQLGGFTISLNPLADHEDLINNLKLGLGYTYKLVIPKKLKLEFLQKLRGHNVRAEILYPDAFGLGKGISDLAKIRTKNLRT